MIDLPYSLVIEATDEPDYFGFFSPELEGFTGIGHSIEDCVYQAKWGMKEHTQRLPNKVYLFRDLTQIQPLWSITRRGLLLHNVQE